jgi:large subunit ribosomal protein L6
MSRIGKLPIPLSKDVKVSIKAPVVSVQGPKGTLETSLPRGISVEMEDTGLVLHRKNDSKDQRALHGLSRALLANAVKGVTEGFSKVLEIHGVGYRALMKGDTVTFTLGYSHPIEYKVPEGIEVKVEKSKITVAGADKQQVGQVAAEMRALRPPDPYKLKGVRYAGERLRRKAGKSGVK